MQIGEWQVEPTRNTLVNGSQELRLETLAMDVLVHLAKAAPETVTSEELLDLFWSGRIVESSTVHRTISKIRRAFGDKPSAPTYIETVPKRGYRIVAPVVREPAQTVAPELLDGGESTEFIVIPGIAAALVEESDVLGLGRVPMTRVNMTIGRAENNDLVLADSSVSKLHATLSLRNREWIIEDQRSTNGVVVNDNHIDTLRLQNGDLVQLGRIDLRFELA